MSTSPVPEPAAPASKPEIPSKEQKAAARPPSRWRKYVTPLLIVLLALAVLITITRNWKGALLLKHSVALPLGVATVSAVCGVAAFYGKREGYFLEKEEGRRG